jgi:hypothetical protein
MLVFRVSHKVPYKTVLEGKSIKMLHLVAKDTPQTLS